MSNEVIAAFALFGFIASLGAALVLIPYIIAAGALVMAGVVSISLFEAGFLWTAFGGAAIAIVQLYPSATIN